MRTNRNIGGSILPSNCPEMLTPLAFKDGKLQVQPNYELDTHNLVFTTGDREVFLASHPNGYSCRSLAERIVSGDKSRINDQADYIARCAGTVNFEALEAL